MNEPIDISQLGKGAVREKWTWKNLKQNLFKRNVKVYIKHHGLPLKAALTLTPYQVAQLFPRKLQGASGSCGGQALANHIRRLKYLRDGTVTDISAYYIYGNCYIPGGGSQESDLANWVKNYGAAYESDCPSYNTDKTPLTEAQMEVKPVLSSDAENRALEQITMISLTFNGNDINEVKQALSLGNGATCAFLGNNTCWQTGDIEIPETTDWGHFIDLLEDTGTQSTWFENSWGDQWGYQGFGKIPDGYFGGGRVYGEYCYILETEGYYNGLLETVENLLVNIINKIKHNT